MFTVMNYTNLASSRVYQFPFTTEMNRKTNGYLESGKKYTEKPETLQNGLEKVMMNDDEAFVIFVKWDTTL